MSELERLIMLWTGDRPDGTRVLGAQGLTYEEHQKLTNMLIEQLEIEKSEYAIAIRYGDKDRAIIDSLSKELEDYWTKDFKGTKEELGTYILEQWINWRSRNKHIPDD